MEILRFKSFSDMILEKSIGSEEIRKKWYSDLDKKEFYKLVNIDPTSVRKKEFSKPGKYVKWLINMYKKLVYKSEYFSDEDFDDYFDSDLNFKLFIFSTGWYKSKVKKESFYLGGELNKTIENDIFKFKTLNEFETHMYKYEEEYRKETEDAKYDVVFSDDKVTILIPINFTASAETAKNTEWCSQSYGGYSMWNKVALLFRIIPKDNKYDKLKLTWNKNNKAWYLACSKYPEIRDYNNPFDKTNGIENWKVSKDKMDNDTNWDKWKENSIKIEETMSLLSEKAKETIKEYYNKNEKSKEV
jgi:hypothetical protein